ncbi:MAG TPA: hypothetical protein VIY48_21295, partial [Candidatus Paceibacterota bacterium]
MNTEIKQHLKVVQHANPKIRTFHTVCELSVSDHFGFGRDTMRLSFLDKEEPGELAKLLAKQLEKI